VTPEQRGYTDFYKGIRFDECPVDDREAWQKGYRKAEKRERELMMRKCK
jgi:hypothetical protein